MVAIECGGQEVAPNGALTAADPSGDDGHGQTVIQVHALELGRIDGASANAHTRGSARVTPASMWQNPYASSLDGGVVESVHFMFLRDFRVARTNLRERTGG